MTPCPNCTWPHYSPTPVTLTCVRCGTVVEVAVEQPTPPAAEKPSRRPKPRAAEKRSRIIRLVESLKAPEDRGVGDTVERLLAKAGGRKFKHLMHLLKLPCGCQNRQKWLNDRFPY
jgi:uncharacterized Zn finger protein (UPF0148 family)